MKLLFLKYAFFALLIIGVISCNKKDDSATDAPTMDAFLQAHPELSLFSKALDKADLSSFKTGPGPFTWFAPTNDAFNAALVTEDSLNRMTPGQVNFLMLYHLANTSLNSVNLVAVNSTARNTQLGGSTNRIYFGNINDAIYINGSKITSADNVVTNGYVHILNRLLVPPILKGDIQTMLMATGQHSLFIQALTKTGLWTQFATGSAFTIFAPTDAAMTAADYTSTSIAAATGTTLTTLTTILKYHYILNLRLFTNDLIRTTLPSTAAGSGIYLTTSENGTKVKGRNNASSGNIIKSDNLGINGVVHIIDLVLKP